MLTKAAQFCFVFGAARGLYVRREQARRAAPSAKPVGGAAPRGCDCPAAPLEVAAASSWIECCDRAGGGGLRSLKVVPCAVQRHKTHMWNFNEKRLQPVKP